MLDFSLLSHLSVERTVLRLVQGKLLSLRSAHCVACSTSDAWYCRERATFVALQRAPLQQLVYPGPDDLAALL